MSLKEATIKWNPNEPMAFEFDDASGFKVIMANSPDPDKMAFGVSPKLLLMISLGGCTGMDVISMLRKMRQEVTGYRLELKGWVGEEHPKKYEKIVVEHIVEGHNLSQDSLDRAIKLSHEKYCGVSASLAGTVEIEMVGRIVEVEKV
jgi:putative redox protein